MSFVTYLKDVKGEVKHISWPTRRQTVAYTILVVVISVAVAAYLGGLDWIFTQFLDAIV